MKSQRTALLCQAEAAYTEPLITCVGRMKQQNGRCGSCTIPKTFKNSAIVVQLSEGHGPDG